ncbi:thiol:disulfide interchange protein DsbD (plasmid) [Paracoccus aminophilus JCM 7686]|uniref:Thiol:disulfide interchange protein DsbD n=2 Tax=Paracoccus aminophilus TaxID=34003 RepID=S5Z180_PARAH|nr:thiol:disulfide interchange protein DsbD [Paracoccus aminophilus JCM 7686]
MTHALFPSRSFPILAAIVALVLAFSGALAAQDFSFSSQRGQPLKPEDAFRMELLDARDGRVEIGWQIAEGYYLYRDQIRAETASGAALTVETPPGTRKDDPNFGSVEVYFEDMTAILPQAGGEIRLSWQGCQEDGICYAPVSQTLSLPDLPAGTSAAAPPSEQPGTGLQLAEDKGLLASLAGKGGATLVLLAFFGFGLMLALTPCVFPMVPILAGMLARQGDALTPRRGAVLSGAYVLAMASAFALFGAVAGWSGQNLQMMLQSPWAVGGVSALFVALALSSFGLFDLQLPAGLAARLSARSGQRGSVAGALALGFTSALIVGPCVTAPLAGAFLYIAQTGDIALGAAALFMLGLGQGAPLFLAGTFGAKILPKAGPWMEAMRRIFGVVFLGLAIWLVERLVPGPLILALWAMLLAGVAVFLGALDRASSPVGMGQRLRQMFGVIALFAAGLLGFGAALGGADPLRPLAPLTGAGPGVERIAGPAFGTVTTPDALSAALGGAPQPSLIYLTADWCVTCKGIERNVLPDPVVAEALRGMRLIKADVSDAGPEGQALMQMIGAAGPPTLVFLDAKGREAPQTRLIGTVTAAGIRASADHVRGLN